MHSNESALSPERIDHLRRVYRDGLLDDVLPFWIRHGVDHEHGGWWRGWWRDGVGRDDARIRLATVPSYPCSIRGREGT